LSRVTNDKKITTFIDKEEISHFRARTVTLGEILSGIGFSLITDKKYSVDNPPGKIEDRVFIAGNYVLMPILREIESVVDRLGYTPIIAADFIMPDGQMADYTLRLLSQCKNAILELTISGGQLVEQVRLAGFKMNILQIYMAKDEERRIPKLANAMDFERPPPPEGYLTIAELREYVEIFLSRISI